MEAAKRADASLTRVCVSASAEDTKRMAGVLAARAFPGTIIMLTGDLGAGKTQFVQGFAGALGVPEAVVSPTFNIVLAYEGARMPLYHFDWYRLDDSEELEDIGFYEYLEAGGVTCIEWAEKFPEKMPDDYLEISLIVDGDGRRDVLARAFGTAHVQLLAEWRTGLAGQINAHTEKVAGEL